MFKFKSLYCWGWSRIKVLDAMFVVNWVSSPICTNITHSSLIMDCREFQSLILQVKVKHCFREANHCADTLAKFGATLQQFFFICLWLTSCWTMFTTFLWLCWCVLWQASSNRCLCSVINIFSPYLPKKKSWRLK